MNLFKTVLILFAVAGLGIFATQLQAAEGMDRGSAPQSRADISRSSMVISDIQGETVKNFKGETLGTVDDVVIGPDARAQYLILARDEGILKEERLYPIPWNMVQLNEKADVLIDLDSARLAKAPNFARDDFPDFDDSSVQNQYSNYFSGTPQQQGSEKTS